MRRCVSAVAMLLGAVTLLGNPPTRAETVVAKIGNGDPVSIAVNPATGRVYTADRGSRTATVYDATTARALASVSTRYRPWYEPPGDPVGVAVDPVLNRVYVASVSGGSFYGPGLTIIDGASFSVLDVRNPGADMYGCVTVDPDSHHVYLPTPNSLLILDGHTGDTLKTIAFPNNPNTPYPHTVAVDAPGKRIYVGFVDGTLAALDADTDSVVQTIKLPYPAFSALAVNTLTHQVYGATGPYLTVTDGPTMTVKQSLTLESATTINAIAADPVANRTYIATYTGDTGASKIRVLDGLSKLLLPSAEIPLPDGSEPRGLALDAEARVLYAADHSLSGISRINLSTRTVLTPLTLGANPIAVAVNPVTNRIYVEDGTQPGRVAVLDGDTNAVLAGILLPFSGNPSKLFVNPTLNMVYVCWQSGYTAAINGATNSVLTSQSYGPLATGVLAVDTSNGCLYGAGPDGIVVLGSSLQPLRTIPLLGGTGYNKMAVDPEHHRLYALKLLDGTTTTFDVQVVDTLAWNIVASYRLPFENNVTGMLVNPATQRLYVVGDWVGTYVLDAETGANRGHLPGGEFFALNPATQRGYVASGTRLYLFDAVTDTWLQDQGLTDLAYTYGIAVNPTTGRIYTICYGDGTMTVIQGPVDTRYTVDDLRRALKLLGGLSPGNAADPIRLKARSAPSAVRMEDVIRIARKAAGLDANP